jgi:transposase
VLQEALNAVTDAVERLARLEAALAEIVPGWTMAPVVAAFQAMRGVDFINAVTIAAEIGDLRRFDSPRQVMSYLGLVPSERSTGETVKRGGITKTGNRRARRVLVEGAWTYRFGARVGRTLLDRARDLPKTVRDIAWKAQLRLCRRYRTLVARGKRSTVVTTAIAREMAAFLWAIAHEVQPRAT